MKPNGRTKKASSRASIGIRHSSMIAPRFLATSGADLLRPRLHPHRPHARKVLPGHQDPISEAFVERGRILHRTGGRRVLDILVAHVVAGEELIPCRLVLGIASA